MEICKYKKPPYPDDYPKYRWIPRAYPLHDPLLEIITPDLDGKGGLSAQEILLRRKIRDAFKGNVQALMFCLKLAAKHEVRRISQQTNSHEYTKYRLNHEFEGVGELAVLLGIAHHYEGPAPWEPDRRDWGQRYQLEEWVIETACRRGCVSEEQLRKVMSWQTGYCMQRRRTREVWT